MISFCIGSGVFRCSVETSHLKWLKRKKWINHICYRLNSFRRDFMITITVLLMMISCFEPKKKTNEATNRQREFKLRAHFRYFTNNERIKSTEQIAISRIHTQIMAKHITASFASFKRLFSFHFTVSFF